MCWWKSRNSKQNTEEVVIFHLKIYPNTRKDISLKSQALSSPKNPWSKS